MLAPTCSATATLEGAPCVITEQQLTFFKFYADQSLQAGMTDGKQLYRLVRQFMAGDRLEAYRYGYELIGQGVPVVISVSEERYMVWRRLRSPVATPDTASPP